MCNGFCFWSYCFFLFWKHVIQDVIFSPDDNNHLNVDNLNEDILKRYVNALRCGDGILASMDVLYLDSMRQQDVICTNKRHKRHFRRKRSHRLSLYNVSMKCFAKYQMYECLMASIHLSLNNNVYLIPLLS